MSAILLVEQTASDIEFLVENTNAGRKFIIEGPFLMTEQINRNKRLYPKDVMEESVELYKKQYVNERRAIGELNHPDYPLPKLEKAALITNQLDWGNGQHANDVIGKATILTTPEGDRIRALMEGGFKMGVSSRGLGEVSRAKGHVRVNKGLILNAIDAVDMPSGQTCYVNQLLESTRWNLNESTGLYEKVVDTEQMENVLNEAFANVGADFMKRLENLAQNV